MGAASPFTTDTSSASIPSASTELVFWLVVMRAPDPSAIGRRLRAAALVVGRDTHEIFRSDRKLSRRHAELVEHAGALTLVDLGSHNGTRVRGKKVDKATLEAGDYVEAGGFGFVVARAKERRALRSDERLVGDSHAFQRVLAEMEAVAASRAHAIVRGDAGSGKTALCERIHARSRPNEPLVWLDARADREISLALADPKRVVDEAARGTLVVEHVDALDAERTERLGALVSAAERTDCRVLFTAARSGLPEHGAVWCLELPSLDERRDDLPDLVATFARRAGAELSLSSSLHAHLATRPYPANVRELENLVERLVRTAPEERDAALGLADEGPSSRPSITVVADGTGFFKDGRRTDLAASPRLAAVLAALVEAHRNGAGSLGPETIAEKAWPGERIIAHAAKNRVYVAVSSLRKLGLRSAIARTPDGYMLFGDFDVVAP